MHSSNGNMRIATINVGADITKRWNNIMEWAKKGEYDIICIQETHISKEKEKSLENINDKYKMYCAHAKREESIEIYREKKTKVLMQEFDFTEDKITLPINPNKAWDHLGMITLIDKNIETSVKKTIIDKEGRYIINVIKINDEKVIILANIYAPTTYTENTKFYPKLTAKIKEIQRTYKETTLEIICGDFNGIIDHSLDKKNQRENQNNYKHIIKMHREKKLKDI